MKSRQAAGIETPLGYLELPLSDIPMINTKEGDCKPEPQWLPILNAVHKPGRVELETTGYVFLLCYGELPTTTELAPRENDASRNIISEETKLVSNENSSNENGSASTISNVLASNTWQALIESDVDTVQFSNLHNDNNLSLSVVTQSKVADDDTSVFDLSIVDTKEEDVTPEYIDYEDEVEEPSQDSPDQPPLPVCDIHSMDFAESNILLIERNNECLSQDGENAIVPCMLDSVQEKMVMPLKENLVEADINMMEEYASNARRKSPTPSASQNHASTSTKILEPKNRVTFQIMQDLEMSDSTAVPTLTHEQVIAIQQLMTCQNKWKHFSTLLRWKMSQRKLAFLRSLKDHAIRLKSGKGHSNSNQIRNSHQNVQRAQSVGRRIGSLKYAKKVERVKAPDKVMTEKEKALQVKATVRDFFFGT